MGKKTLYLLLAVLLLIPAYALEIQTETIENRIFLDEQARYNITVHNPDTTTKIVQFFTTDIKWYVELEPSITRLGPNETAQSVLRLIPSVWAETGAQNVIIRVQSPGEDEQTQINVPIYVRSFEQQDRQYVPSVEMRVDFPEEVDPRENFPLNIYLRNRNRLDIHEMTLSIQSALFSQTRTVALDPLSERTEKFTFNIDDLTRPGQDQLEVTLTVANKTINVERARYEVISYAEFETLPDRTQELFKTTSQYTIINKGNVQKTDTFSVPTSFLRRLFTNTDPAPTSINLKENQMTWKLTIDPQDEIQVNVIVNYRPLIYFLLIAIVVSMVYFLYRSPLVVKKESLVMGSSKDGISEMKVLIHVRNRSQELMENITVTDLIPSIAGLVRESHVGTLSPSKVIRHQKKGTIIKWEIEALEPFEERIISYRIKSKITIVGGFTLPSVKVKFMTGRNKERIVKSNKSQVNVGL